MENNKLKIAVLFTGSVFGYKKNYDNFMKYIIQDNDVDFYYDNNKEYGENIDGFIELYKPKIVVNESLPNFENEIQKYKHLFDYNAHYSETGRLGINIFRSAFRTFRTFKIIKNMNIKYDLVIFSRLDLIFYKNIDYSIINNNYNKMFLPNDYNHWFDLLNVDFSISFGSMEIMEKHSEFYNYIDYLIESGVKYHPETLFAYYLKLKNIDHDFFPMVHKTCEKSHNIRRNLEILIKNNIDTKNFLDENKDL